jgi:hypothetical protein
MFGTKANLNVRRTTTRNLKILPPVKLQNGDQYQCSRFIIEIFFQKGRKFVGLATVSSTVSSRSSK